MLVVWHSCSISAQGRILGEFGKLYSIQAVSIRSGAVLFTGNQRFTENIHNKKRPTMIYATADAHPCIPIYNLSTAYKHYGTYTNLCSTIRSTYGAYCNLSTAADPNYQVKLS